MFINGIQVLGTDLVGGLEKVGVVVGEGSQVLLVLAAVGDVLLEDLPPVDGRGSTVTPFEIRPLMRRRSSSTRRTEGGHYGFSGY